MLQFLLSANIKGAKRRLSEAISDDLNGRSRTMIGKKRANRRMEQFQYFLSFTENSV